MFQASLRYKGCVSLIILISVVLNATANTWAVSALLTHHVGCFVDREMACYPPLLPHLSTMNSLSSSNSRQGFDQVQIYSEFGAEQDSEVTSIGS